MRMYQLLWGSHYDVVDEVAVQRKIDSLPEGSVGSENGKKVLELEVDQSITLESGAQWKRLADDSPKLSAIICGRGQTNRRCEFCGKQPKGDGRLCDGPPKRRGKKTCDAFMCRGCAKNVGPDRDLCPRCVATPQASLPGVAR